MVDQSEAATWQRSWAVQRPEGERASGSTAGHAPVLPAARDRAGRADSAVVPLSLRRYYRWVCLDSNGREGEGDIFLPLSSPPLTSSSSTHTTTIEDLSSTLHHQPTRAAALWRIEGGGLDLHLHRPDSRFSISSLFCLFLGAP